VSSRQYVVEATTPEGCVEFGAEATKGAQFAGVVQQMVQDHAAETGCTERDITVTSAWWTPSE
jgi:hypothetical protein